jgi:hypothetical protein
MAMYESGLPTWAILLPSYGLWYRPWLRRVTWITSLLITIFSMACGFYDLYHNVPYLKQLVIWCFRPATSIFEWLEEHTQVRHPPGLTHTRHGIILGSNDVGLSFASEVAVWVSSAKTHHQVSWVAACK